MNINDFCAACEWLNGDGADIRDATYQGQHFGSWFIEVHNKGQLRRAAWDARDGWLYLQTLQPDGDWSDDWIGHHADEQTVERVIQMLGE